MDEKIQNEKDKAFIENFASEVQKLREINPELFKALKEAGYVKSKYTYEDIMDVFAFMEEYQGKGKHILGEQLVAFPS